MTAGRMAIRCGTDVPEAPDFSPYGAGRTLAIAAVMVFAFGGTSESASNQFCTQTATALFTACQAGVQDDSFVKKAICINVSDAQERTECSNELNAERDEGNQLCQEQQDWRRQACKSLGEGRYDPEFDPALFDDPRHPTKPNPYFPLAIGNRWEFRSGDEVDVVEVVDESKLMEAGVECIVVRDLVTRDGDLAEATDDWYAHAKDGSTWYCGEEVKDSESFDGDDPRRPELVSIDGSFKAGRDRDKPGIIFPASPTKGAVYLEEFSLANAEDVTEILSTTYKFGSNPQLDQSVPKQLAKRLCSSGDCVVTKNFSLLEPGLSARKYYARGIGVFLEIESTGEVIQLENCNFDSRCNHLPHG